MLCYFLGQFYKDSGRKFSLCIASQFSVERMDHLPQFLEKWRDVPISVSIFVPGYCYHFVEFYLERLKRCNLTATSYLSIHLVYPQDNPPSNQKIIPTHQGCDLKLLHDEIKEIMIHLKESKVRL